MFPVEPGQCPQGLAVAGPLRAAEQPGQRRSFVVGLSAGSVRWQLKVENSLHPVLASFPTSPPALSQVEDHGDNKGMTTDWSGWGGLISESRGKVFLLLLEALGPTPESSAAFFFGKLRAFNTWSSSTDSV